MYGETIRTYEQVEKELEAITWHIEMLKCIGQVGRIMAIKEIDRKIAEIDKKLEAL